MLPADEPFEWYIRSEIFRCIINGLILAQNQKLESPNIQELLERIDIPPPVNKWQGECELYCQLKMHPVVSDLLENLSILSIASGDIFKIRMPTWFFCNSNPNTTNV